MERHGGRFVNHRGTGFIFGYGYAPTLPYWDYYGAPVDYQQPLREVYTPEPDRPRRVIYNLPPRPLSQGDIGYVASPAVYSVREVLGRYPSSR
jgi:hypothetical protein